GDVGVAGAQWTAQHQRIGNWPRTAAGAAALVRRIGEITVLVERHGQVASGSLAVAEAATVQRPAHVLGRVVKKERDAVGPAPAPGHIAEANRDWHVAGEALRRVERQSLLVVPSVGEAQPSLP